MVKIVWSKNALNDLKAINDFISLGSKKFAKITINKIINKSSILSKFPNSGRVIPEKNNKIFRELVIGNYRLMYEVKDIAINILAVHHSARKFVNI